MIHSLIFLLAVCIAIGLIWWLVDYVPVPHPLDKMVKIVSIVIGAILLIYILLQLGGVEIPR